MLMAALFAMVLAGVSRRRILTILQVLAAGRSFYVLARFCLFPAAPLNRVTREQPLAEDPRLGIWKRGLAVFGITLFSALGRRLCASDGSPGK